MTLLNAKSCRSILVTENRLVFIWLLRQLISTISGTKGIHCFELCCMKRHLAWRLEIEIMYCLQWLIPVLLIPKPLSPALLLNHAMFMVLYLTGFFLERKPCSICSIVFLVALFLICYNCVGNCLFWRCADDPCSGPECWQRDRNVISNVPS